ncbi:hypothetical protein JW823_09965 [bacterium]|nr:hypothetical protein [candidate division CSSED10-310 bacterium]
MIVRATTGLRGICGLVLICLCLPPVSTAETPWIDLDEIRPGMICHGLSYFSTNTPENLEIEILGIVNAGTSESAFILARVDSPSIQRGGIMAGMSGSPVYYGERLVGAISQAFAFAREPMCGITPIAAMRRLSELDRAEGRTSFHGPMSFRSSGLNTSDQLRPIGLTLQTAGIPPLTVTGNLSTPNLQLSPITGPSITGETVIPHGNNQDILPGSPIAVGLVTGDVSITVFGTVTDVDDETIFAFGHPMFGLGHCRLPLHASDVISFVPTLYISFKVANPGPPIGTLLFDSEAGIMGELGPIPPVIPVELTIEGLTPEKTVYHFSVADHEYLSTNLIAQAVFGLLRNLGGLTGDLAMRADLTVDLENNLTLRQSYVNGNVVSLFDSIMAAIDIIDQIHRNPIEPVTFRQIGIRCRLSQSTMLSTLDTMSVARKTCRPGETIRVNLGFHGDRITPFTRTIQLEIPESIPAGRYSLKALDSATHRLMINARTLPRHYYDSLETWWKTLNEPIAGNQILVGLIEDVNDVQTQNAILPAAPPVLQGLMTMPGMDNRVVRSFRILASETVTVDQEVIGVHQLPIFINIRPENIQ